MRAHYFLKLHPVSCTVPLFIIYSQSFISIPLARDYYSYYNYYYSYYNEYSRSQWISRLQLYCNFELTPRVRSENRVDLTCLQSWPDLPMKLTQLACLPLHPWLYRHFELPSTVRAENKVATTSRSGNGYTGTLIRRVALTDLVTSLFPFHPLRQLFHLHFSSRSWFHVQQHFFLFSYPTFNPSEK